MVDSVNEDVEEQEGLVNKLMNEIMDWNAVKKLCRRDEELEEIQILCSDLVDDLCQEKQNTEIELEKNMEKQQENQGQEMVDKDGNKVDIMDDLVRLENTMRSYTQEIDELLELIQDVDDARNDLTDDFTDDLPPSILKMRHKRHMNQKSEKSNAVRKPAQLFKRTSKLEKQLSETVDPNEMEIYDMISINCKYKQSISHMLKDLKDINKKRNELEDKYQGMRKEVFQIKQIKLYKPVKGDAVDEMFAGYLNKA